MGHSDFGFYGAKQVQRGRPREGQIPERGVDEMKAAGNQVICLDYSILQIVYSHKKGTI